MKKIVFLLSLVFCLFANEQEKNANVVQVNNVEVSKNPEGQEAQKFEQIENLKKNIKAVEEKTRENILLRRYDNYLAHKQIAQELQRLENEYEKIANKKGEKYDEQRNQLENKIKIKKNEFELISEYKDSPIGNLIVSPEIVKNEPISNPFGIINALSYIEKIENNRDNYANLYDDIANLISLLENKISLSIDLYKLEPSESLESRISFLAQQKEDFLSIMSIVSATNDVYSRKVEQVILEVKDQIDEQIKKTLKILFVILFLFFITFLLKTLLRKYYLQNENYHMINKIINFIIVFVVLLILLFTYIDNVSYIVTILGFASAGIAIALKDWFMSIFGWLVIVTSGSINVGDRIKVQKNDIEVVGDVLDISLFKMTIREDVTLTSYMKNRRTGRIVFIPNNYIFLEVISNYTHGDLRTVWDGIDITITFDSNYKKAQQIAKEILKQHSKGYADLTRKQLSKMRSKYSLRATGVEPRVFTFVEPYGIVVSAWYLTNSYAALALRSNISPEILQAFMKEDDIQIAYPTHSVNIQDKTASLSDIKKASATGLF